MTWGSVCRLLFGRMEVSMYTECVSYHRWSVTMFPDMNFLDIVTVFSATNAHHIRMQSYRYYFDLWWRKFCMYSDSPTWRRLNIILDPQHWMNLRRYAFSSLAKYDIQILSFNPNPSLLSKIWYWNLPILDGKENNMGTTKLQPTHVISMYKVRNALSCGFYCVMRGEELEK